MGLHGRFTSAVWPLLCVGVRVGQIGAEGAKYKRLRRLAWAKRWAVSGGDCVFMLRHDPAAAAGVKSAFK